LAFCEEEFFAEEERRETFFAAEVLRGAFAAEDFLAGAFFFPAEEEAFRPRETAAPSFFRRAAAGFFDEAFFRGIPKKRKQEDAEARAERQRRLTTPPSSPKLSAASSVRRLPRTFLQEEMPLFEFAIIISPELTAPAIEKKLDKFRAELKKRGKIVEEEIWGMRDLAYKIDKQERGFYAIFFIEAEAGAFYEMEKELRFDKEFLRHLLLRHDDPEFQSLTRLEEEGSSEKEKEQEKKVTAKTETVVEEEEKKSRAKKEDSPAAEKKEEEGKKKTSSSAEKKKDSDKQKTSLDDLDAALDKLLED